MSSKFDEYLNKGGFSQQDKEAMGVEKAEDVKDNSAPTTTVDQSKEVDTKQPDIAEDRKDGIESTQKDGQVAYDQVPSANAPVNEESKAQADQALETPQEPKQGVEAQYPSSAEKGEEDAPQQEQQQDIDR